MSGNFLADGTQLRGLVADQRPLEVNAADQQPSARIAEAGHGKLGAVRADSVGPRALPRHARD